ncbi:carboxylesterase 1-like [Mercurialis annua]|uniref:carboxylesterase 1-like n=1 Tax=Mercurialis annua TaxID=3986 RepID=UPI00215F4842|nr:carboxylesterase 1-like [Mercurialis annua]
MAENKTFPVSSSDDRPKIFRNPDGTYTRLINFPTIPASPDPGSSTSPVLSKDLTINPTNQTWLRIYLPRHLLDQSSSTEFNKLPLIVYYHGGGFVFLNADSNVFHDFCITMAEKVNAIVISVDYRNAPEHRLPAAYEDAVEALHCVKTSQDGWITNFADLSNCFLMGSSAGGNIAYHAGLRVCENIQNLYPLKIKGLILHHPFFGGSERTMSELKMVNDPVLPPAASDFMWDLSLPVGSNRDHEYCNPMSELGFNVRERIIGVGLRVMVTGGREDPLIDRQVEFAKMLEEKGVKCLTHFGAGYHGVELTEPSKGGSLLLVVKDFIS